MSDSPYYPIQVISAGATSSGLNVWPRGGGLEIQAGGTLIGANIDGDFGPNDGIYSGGFVYDDGLIVDAVIGDTWSSGGATYTGTPGLLVVEQGGVSEYAIIGVLAGAQIGDMVISSGGYAYDTDFDLGLLTVEAGGSAKVVIGDDVAEVIAGGTVSSSFINFHDFGGAQTITSGGTAYDTTLTANNVVLNISQTISSGTATRNVLTGNSTEQIVSAGGSAVSTTLTSGAVQLVAGGTVVSTSMGSATSAFITGGTVSDSNVSSGAFIFATGGTLTGTTIQNGGEVLALPGVTVKGSVVKTGGELVTGGVATVLITTPPGGGFVTDIESLIPAPTVATGLDILAPRDIDGNTPAQPTTYVWNGGSATSLSSDGVVEVAKGGQVSDVTDDSLAAYNPGGITGYTYATIGVLNIDSGGVASNVTVSGADFTVANGGTVNGLSVGGFSYALAQDNTNYMITGYVTVNQDGQATLQAGAVASGGIEVTSLGALYVADHASGIVVSVGGQVVVQAGGVTTGTSVVGDFASNGYETVYGTASGSVLGNDGVETVVAGGVASRTDDVQGQIDVDGGRIVSAVVSGSGVAYISGGIASATQLTGTGGEQVVYAGGTAISTFIDKDEEDVAGGTASGGYTGESGFERVESGGKTVRDVISGAQAEESVFSGIAISTHLSDGATLLVHAGGSATAATVSGGAEEMVGGGIASGSIIGNSGLLNVLGTPGVASNTSILSGGEAEILQGGILRSATVSGGALAVFTTGGVGQNVTVLRGGTAIADATAILTGLVVSNGGTLVLSAGTAFAPVSGAPNVSGVVSAGGVVAVGGIVVSSSVTLEVPGLETANIISGGLSLLAGARLDYSAPDIKNGGVLSVGSGGAVYQADVESGGTLVLAAGAVAYDTSGDGGGTIVDNGALIFEPLPSVGAGVNPPVGNLDLQDAITGTGNVVFTGGGMVTDTIVDTGTGNVTLGANTEIELDNSNAAGTGEIVVGKNAELLFNYSPVGNVYSNALAGLTAGDTLLFALTTNGTPEATLNGDVLNLSDGNQYNENLDLTGSSVGNAFTAVDDGGVLEVLVQALTITGAYTVGDGDTASGLTVATGGDASVAAGGVVSGPIIAGGTLELGAGSTVTGNITFSGSGRLVVDGSDPTNEIYGFAPGDSIKLANVPYDSSDQVVVDHAGIVTIVTPSGDYDFNIAGATVGETGFMVAGDLLLTTQDALCFVRGTRILTPVGEVPVESLGIGDLVVTRFGGIQPVRWIGRQTYDARFLANHPDKWPVRIAAGALGAGSPMRDLFVSPGHSLLLGDVLVLADRLINGVSVTQAQPAHGAVEYFQIELAAHDCVIAQGAFAETYADAPGMRAQFHNAAEYAALYPEAPPPEALVLCAPRPAGGARLEAALATVVARAAVAVPPGALEGFVDQISAWQVDGWAIDQAQPDLPVLLEVLTASEVLGTVLASGFRADLAQAGKGSGRCAFSFTPPARLPQDVEITVRRASDGAGLAASNTEQVLRVQ